MGTSLAALMLSGCSVAGHQAQAPSPSGPAPDLSARGICLSGVHNTPIDDIVIDRAIAAPLSLVKGPSVSAFQTIQVSCRLQGFAVADGNNWWYRIAPAPWSNAYYVSADAFYNNGATSGSLAGTPFVDTAVASC
ncbi:hypothetical protein GCM10028801_26940 [Nocardioides maradonensis]